MRRLPVGLLLSFPLAMGAASAEGYLRGSEIPINNETAQHQGDSDVAMTPLGEFIVVWSGYGAGGGAPGIFARRFDSSGAPIGAQFQVNTYTSLTQQVPSVATDGDGNFLVVWSGDGDGSMTGVSGRAFSRKGTASGPEFQINTYTTGAQAAAVVASDGSDSFVVAWQSNGQDGSSWGIRARLIDGTGTPLGPEIQVNTYTTADQVRASVGMSTTGEFIVAWDGPGQDGDGRGVIARTFSASGAALGPEFQVNSYTTAYQFEPSAGIDGLGNIAVAWVSQGQDGSLGGIFGRMLDGAGSPLGPEFQINTYTTENQRDPSIAVDAAGSFAVVWESYGPDGSDFGVSGRRYDAMGAPRGGEFAVHTYTTSPQAEAAVAADPRGNFVVVWQSYEQDGSDYGIFGQLLAGPPLVTDPPLGGQLDCSDPATLIPTIIWDGSPFDRYRVFLGWDPGFPKGTRVTSGKRLLTSSSWTPPAKKWRRACMEALAADPGNPVLYIRVFGVDQDVPKGHPGRKNIGNVRQADVLPP
jgi:hypothetical protein